MNADAAQLSFQKTYYCSTVHSAYYSCVLLMKYILLNNLNKTEAQIKAEGEANKENSHVYMIREVGNYLKRSQNPSAADFVKKINDLKKLRVKADYEDVQIDFKLGNASLQLSNESNKILQKII